MHCAKTDEVYVAVTGEAQNDPELKRILNEALLNTPDANANGLDGAASGKAIDPARLWPRCHVELVRAFTRGKIFAFSLRWRTWDHRCASAEPSGTLPGLNIAGTFSPP